MTEQTAQRLHDTIKQRLDADVEMEQVRPGRFRYAVVSPAFVGVPGLTRQDQVWGIVDEILTPQETLDVSLVLCYAPDDLAELRAV